MQPQKPGFMFIASSPKYFLEFSHRQTFVSPCFPWCRADMLHHCVTGMDVTLRSGFTCRDHHRVGVPCYFDKYQTELQLVERSFGSARCRVESSKMFSSHLQRWLMTRFQASIQGGSNLPDTILWSSLFWCGSHLIETFAPFLRCESELFRHPRYNLKYTHLSIAA